MAASAIVAACAGETPEQKAFADVVQLATGAAVVLRKSMRNPDSFTLESVMLINGTRAICYEYRAQNGFGGFNPGRAVVMTKGESLVTNEMPGFQALWEQECADRDGRQIRAKIPV